MWADFFAAVCLMFVLEGMLPFLSPRRWRGMVQLVAMADDRSLRRYGLCCMVLGAGLLYLVRSG